MHASLFTLSRSSPDRRFLCCVRSAGAAALDLALPLGAPAFSNLWRSSHLAVSVAPTNLGTHPNPIQYLDANHDVNYNRDGDADHHTLADGNCNADLLAFPNGISDADTQPHPNRVGDTDRHALSKGNIVVFS